jgi:hypothetical protein
MKIITDKISLEEIRQMAEVMFDNFDNMVRYTAVPSLLNLIQ